jgi:tryptophan synthase alpha chain
MNGITHIEQHFKKGKQFVAYLTAGDGGMDQTLKAALALIKGGVTLLELGVPFSDPTADGPVIQRAAARALEAGTTLKDVLWLATEIRKHSDIPLILFSYLNPLLQIVEKGFFEKAKLAGIDGALIVDCPIEESGAIHHALIAHDIAPIYVVTPTTPVSRIQKIDQYGKGFLYYACRKGTTGIKTSLPDDFADKAALIKSHTTLPVIAGFGIANRADAEQVLQYVDGVVIGSLFVKALEDGVSMDELSKLAANLKPLI